MPEQERTPYRPVQPQVPDQAYTGPGKLGKEADEVVDAIGKKAAAERRRPNLDDVLDIIDKKVRKDNLADTYIQQGGQ